MGTYNYKCECCGDTEARKNLKDACKQSEELTDKAYGKPEVSNVSSKSKDNQ